MTPLSRILAKLTEMEKLAEAAQPAPWESDADAKVSDYDRCYSISAHGPTIFSHGTGSTVVIDPKHWNQVMCDAAFIAASRTQWPATVRALKASLNALKKCTCGQTEYERCDNCFAKKQIADALEGK